MGYSSSPNTKDLRYCEFWTGLGGTSLHHCTLPLLTIPLSVPESPPSTTTPPAVPLASLSTDALLSAVTTFWSSLPSAGSNRRSRCALFSTPSSLRSPLLCWPHLSSHVQCRSIRSPPEPPLLLHAIPTVAASSCIPSGFFFLLLLFLLLFLVCFCLVVMAVVVRLGLGGGSGL
ncbi:hypothetical protein PIB30_050397 [Stylosanthes scabra]|uniref:Uncharacterized protein n=1 Tax=Stylosanthes scabra TaxID=79078 RepID=A0ABU6UKF8_9FABA|nr:hypothetical protein [Stylosanthes scabra]